MKKYVSPNFEVIEMEDIITTSMGIVQSPDTMMLTAIKNYLML